MSVTKTKRAVLDMLVDVSKDGEALHLIAPENGGLTPSLDYYNMKLGILRKTPAYWKRGRAGFACSRHLKGQFEEAGLWIFPDLAAAVAKRAELLAEGWTVKLISWEELQNNT